MPQVAEDLFSNGLCENVCNVFGGTNLICDNCSITNKTSKVMILDGNMLCNCSKIWSLCNRNTALIIFPDSAKKTGSLVSSPNKPEVSFIRLINGINSLIEVDRAMYLL